MTDLLPALLAEHQPQSTLERHLTAQLAHILAKQTQAEDNEVYLLGKQPEYLLTHRPDGHLVPDPAYLLYNNRLDALRLHQARLGREQSRILRELHRLKRTPLATKAASEPGGVANQNVASEPSVVVAAPASEPNGAVAARPRPLMARSRRAMTEVAGTADVATEPKKPVRTDPVLDDATAGRIEAMIASGDIGQLEKAARLLGLLDGAAPIPPPGFLEKLQSKLAG